MNNYFCVLLAVLVAALVISINLQTPQPPSNLTVLSAARSITLHWEASSQDDIAFYIIEISLTPQTFYSEHGRVPHPTTTYTITGLFTGATYFVRVRALTTRNIKSNPTQPVAVTISELEEAKPPLQALPGDGLVELFWTAQTSVTIYASLSPEGPYHSIARDVTEQKYTVTGLSNGRVYYFRVAVVNEGGQEENIGGPIAAMPGDLLNFAEDNTSYWVGYRVGDKFVEYRFNKKTVQGEDGLYEQFISDIRYDNIPITARPYPGGLKGLILMRLGERTEPPTPPTFEGVPEILDDQKVVLRYVNSEPTDMIRLGKAEIRFEFEKGKPYLKVAQYIIPSKEAFDGFYVSWNVSIAFGGQYNPRNRVVVPYDEKSYYVINGQALGIHYNPRIDTWSLRMGAEGTPYAHVTAGFFFANPADVQPAPEWPMAHDYCDGASGDPQDQVPYGLDQIRGQIYLNYQEDEGGSCIPGGLGYSWQNAELAPRIASPSKPYINEFYYWVGEDFWTGEYGLNYNASYQFNIKYWHDKLHQHP
jgi:hypothetical protein